MSGATLRRTRTLTGAIVGRSRQAASGVPVLPLPVFVISFLFAMIVAIMIANGAAEAAARLHVVQPGETLSAIARRYDTTWQTLQSMNALANPDLIHPGQTLRVPDATGTASDAGQADPGASSRNGAWQEPAAGEGSPVAQQSRKAGVLALTFNGGPHPTHTPYLLRLLDAYKLQATFFFEGHAVRRHPEIVAQAARAGHSIQTQGFQGLPDSVATIRNAFAEAISDLQAISGRRPRYYRPPGAVLTPALLDAARQENLQVIFWTNIGAEDLPGIDATTLVRRLKDRVHPGAILMLRADRATSAAALADLLPIWTSAGHQFLTLERLQRLFAE